MFAPCFFVCSAIAVDVAAGAVHSLPLLRACGRCGGLIVNAIAFVV